METRNGKNNQEKKSGMSGWWMPVIILLAVLISSAISWALVSNLAAAKSDLNSEIGRINNTVGHMKDAQTGLNGFASNQNSKIETLSDTTQNALGDVNSKINGANAKITNLSSKTDTLQTNLNTAQARTDSLTNQLTAQGTQLSSQIADANQKTAAVKTTVDTLTTNINSISTNLGSVTGELGTLTTNLGTITASVNSIIGGLQITPTVSATASNGGTGSITLGINSSSAQTVAFRVEFRPTTDMAQNTTMDASMAALYLTPPVTLYQNYAGGTLVRGDYSLYWASDGKYHLGYITFITQPTALVAGSNSKTLYFTYQNAIAPSFEVLITPQSEANYTTTGGYVTTW